MCTVEVSLRKWNWDAVCALWKCALCKSCHPNTCNGFWVIHRCAQYYSTVCWLQKRSVKVIHLLFAVSVWRLYTERKDTRVGCLRQRSTFAHISACSTRRPGPARGVKRLLPLSGWERLHSRRVNQPFVSACHSLTCLLLFINFIRNAKRSQGTNVHWRKTTTGAQNVLPREQPQWWLRRLGCYCSLF